MILHKTYFFNPEMKNFSTFFKKKLLIQKKGSIVPMCQNNF